MQAIKNFYLYLLLSTSLIGGVIAQSSYSIFPEESELTIYGTSTLHDWQIVAEKMDGKCTVVLRDGTIETVNKLGFEVDVDGLKSGKSGMDDNTIKALHQDEYPSIRFKLKSVERTAASSDQESTILVTKGMLTVTDFTKEINLKVAGKMNADGSIQFIGRTVFNMTDFKIDPPTAVFGTIETGDEITIIFKIVFKKK